MLKKLKHKFILITMLIVIFILLICFISLNMVAYRMTRNQIIMELNNISADVIGDDDMLIDDDKRDESNLFDKQEHPPFASFTVIISSDNSIKAAYANKELTSVTSDISSATDAILNSDKRNGILYDSHIIFHEFRRDKETVITFTSLNTLLSRSALVTNASAIVIACCGALFFVLIYILAGVAMHPVERAWEREKQFVADASHDLKTPLTVIMANTEIIRNHKSNSIDEVAKWLDSTEEEAQRMKRLVESMLELAQSECINESISLTPVNVSDICESTVLQMEAIAFEKHVCINTSITKNITIKSHSDYFTRLVHILIDNAIKYSAENASVTVKLKKQKREVKLSIHNVGALIAEEDIPHIFERFWRSDRARTTESFGLGLSIAKNLCENLGGKISVVSEKSHGTEFTATFPI